MVVVNTYTVTFHRHHTSKKDSQENFTHTDPMKRLTRSQS